MWGRRAALVFATTSNIINPTYAAAAQQQELSPAPRAREKIAGELETIRYAIASRQTALEQLRRNDPADSFFIPQILQEDRQKKDQKLAAFRQQEEQKLKDGQKAVERDYASELSRIEQAERQLAAERREIQDQRAALSRPSPEVGRIQGQIRSAEAQKAQLIDEQRIVIAELRAGHFCSKCMRSKFEIESSGQETFEQHLVKVGGTAVLGEDQIQARSAQYDQRITQAQSRVEALQTQLQTARRAHAQAVEAKRNQLGERERQLQQRAENLTGDRQRAADKRQGLLGAVEMLRASLPRRVQERDRELEAPILAREQEWERRQQEHRQRLSRATAELDERRQYETLLTEELRSLDDPTLREIYAERLADEDIQRQQRISRFVDTVLATVKHDPAQNQWMVRENVVELAMRELGLDATSQRLRREIEAEYRRALINRYRQVIECRAEVDC